MIVKNTTELVEGDIVLNHGMRILLDGPADTYPSQNNHGLTVYHWPGLVLNGNDICNPEHADYDRYVACHIRGQWREDIVPLPRLDNWPVQGNELATWLIEEPGT